MRFNKVQDVESCLVRLFSDNDEVVGTGFLIGNGYVLTCRHVVSDILSKQKNINVTNSSSPTNIANAQVQEIAEEFDIALLKLGISDLSLPLSDKGDNEPGDRAWACGFQLIKRLGEKPYLADALISSMDASGMLLLEASLLPGMSGAPIFNLSSRKVVGVVTSRITKDDGTQVNNTALAVPVEKIISLWPWLREINDKSTKRFQIDKYNLFKSEVATLLRDDFGAYIEKDQTIDGQVVDVIASHRGIGRSVKTAVFCIPESVSREAIVEIGTMVVSLRNKNDVDDGLIVTNQIIEGDLRRVAKSYPISCKTVRDLEDDVLGLSTYIEKLINDYENAGNTVDERHSPIIPELSKLNSRQYYVDLDAVDQNEIKYQPADAFFSKWLEQDTANIVSLIASDTINTFEKQVSILGDSGVGKTSFCLHLTYFIARNWRDKKLARVPLYIPLKGYSPTKGLSEVIETTLKRYGIRSDFEQILRHTVENGKFLIIFDGFDEMGASVQDADIQKRFDEISRFAEKYGKVVLTCRSNFFQFEADEKRALSPLDVASQLVIQTQKRKAYILYIEPFDEPKILEFLNRHPSIAGSQLLWWEKIKNISNMSSLSHRPILLRMLVEAIPSIEKIDGDISVARLYITFIDNLLLQDKLNRRTLLLEPQDRLEFLKALSIDLMSIPDKSFAWSDLPVRTHELFTRFMHTNTRPDYVEYDLRNIPLLQRRGDKFSFIHDSFVEFLTALNIVGLLIKKPFEINKDFEKFQDLLNEEVRKFIVEIIELFEQTDQFQYVNTVYDNNFVLIPDGPFICGGYEKGLTISTISHSFLIGKYPITWKEYEKFSPGYRENRGLTDVDDMAPVTYVSWDDANAYCAWLSRKEGKRYRLPNKHEWEKAARGIDGRLYPWGDKPATHSKANYGYRYNGIVPVDSFNDGKSPYGAMDMSGNVYELTSSSEDEGVSHICCGGSWEDPASRIQCATQRKVRFNAISHDIGFRIVEEID